jgi:CRISPR-associated protein Cas1
MQEVSVDDTPSEDAIEAAEQAAKAADKAARAAPPEPEPEPESSRRARWLFPVYVIEPGRKLETKGARLRLVDEAGRITDLPPGRIDRIELGPDTDATLDALDMAAANDIDIVRVNGHGEVVARYEPEGPTRARRHLAQARTILEPTRRLDLACRIAKARIHNQRALLRRLNREREDMEIAAAAQKIGRIMLKLTIAESVPQAMGIEGEAAALFWPAFGRCFPETFRFSRRTRKPAADAANLVISILSGILSRDLRAMALRAGLHPGFGALHESQDGGDALVHDLIEPLRSPIAEACTSALFNRGALSEGSFTDDSAGFRLNRTGWATVIRGYEAWVTRPVRSQQSGEQLLWRGVMLEQAQGYARHCEGEAEFQPYMMDY